MIVDSAIVVLENTYRHMEKGQDRVTAAVSGSEEVWSAIVASSLTQVAVFVPLLFLTGIASIMFGSLAIVVIFSLSVSLFVAVTLVPVLCSRLLRVPQPNGHPGAMGRFVTTSGRALEALDDGYRRLLHRALGHRAVVVVVAGALFVASLAALPLVGFELAPAADEGQVRVTAELPVGTRIERSADALQRIEQLVERSYRRPRASWRKPVRSGHLGPVAERPTNSTSPSTSAAATRGRVRARRSPGPCAGTSLASRA